MSNPTNTDLSQRVTQLEVLAWSLFRALETYITFSELEAQIERTETDERQS